MTLAKSKTLHPCYGGVFFCAEKKGQILAVCAFQTGSADFTGGPHRNVTRAIYGRHGGERVPIGEKRGENKGGLPKSGGWGSLSTSKKQGFDQPHVLCYVLCSNVIPVRFGA